MGLCLYIFNVVTIPGFFLSLFDHFKAHFYIIKQNWSTFQFFCFNIDHCTVVYGFNNTNSEQAVVAERFRACVKFKQTLTRRPGLESPLGITISISQKQKYFVAIQIAGSRVTCVAYNIEPSVDAIKYSNNSNIAMVQDRWRCGGLKFEPS